jgi:hypothetical protein
MIIPEPSMFWLLPVQRSALPHFRRFRFPPPRHPEPFAMKSIICCALVLLAAHQGLADDCCQSCGCDAQCCKVCRCVPSTKKVTKTEYSCECEDFCVPGPSLRTVCRDECGKKKIVYTPTCAEVRTRKKLAKKETSRNEPTTKWVVENLCPKCADQKTSAPAPAPKDATADGRVAQPDFAALAEPGVDTLKEISSTPSLAARVRSDLARVLLPAGSQK